MPPWKEEIRRFRHRYIRKHRANDTHHLVPHLDIRHGLYFYRKITLNQMFRNFEVRDPDVSDVNTHSYCYEDYSRSREKIGMVQALPDRIPTTFRVSINCHLKGGISTFSRQTVGNIWHTSVANQNLWGNRRNILVYVVITIPWIASCLSPDDSPSDVRKRKEKNDTYEARMGEIGHHHSEAPQG